jgi:subtilisin family serine protease
MYQTRRSLLMAVSPSNLVPPMKLHSRHFRAAGAAPAVLLAALLGIGTHAAAKSPSDPEVAGELLVRLRSTAALQPLLAKYALSLAGQFGSRPIYRLVVAAGTNTHDIIGALELEPDVLDADPNAIHSSPEARRNNAWTIGTPAAYTAQWAPQALHLAQAHTLSTGAGVRVAVLDTGVDATHPALAGKLLPGFDFVDNDLDPSEVGTPGVDLGFGHGTHVAGLVSLAAPGAQIVPLRVLDRAGQGNAWVLAEAMLYAVDPDANPQTNDGAQVINMSLGSVSRTHVLDTITKLAACALPAPTDPENDLTDPGYNGDRERCAAFVGAAVIAAAGNDASEDVRQYPAAEGAYGLLPVTASNAARGLASFSNFGSWVDIAAPGDGITSTVPGGGYGTWSGTSMAAPLAAGSAALLRAREPALAARDVVKRLIEQSASLCGTDLRQIDPYAVLRNVEPPDVACPRKKRVRAPR